MRLVLAALVLSVISCTPPPELASVSKPAKETDTLFRDIAVFDGRSLSHHQDVLIRGTHVDSVSDTGSIARPSGVTEIRGTGLTLLPGLVDSHVHLISAGEKHPPAPTAEAIAQAFLYAGVTTILVTAGFDEVIALREQQAAGTALAPKIYWGGPGLTGPGAHPIPLLNAMLPWPVRWFVTRSLPTAANAQEAREQVEMIVSDHGPEFVKIIYDDLPPGSPHLSREALRGAIAAANDGGVRAIVHTTTSTDTFAAIDAGAALLVHVPQRSILSDAEVQRLVQAAVPLVTTTRLPSASYELAEHGPSRLEREMYGTPLLQPWQDEPRWELSGFSEEIDERHAEVAADTQLNTRKLIDATARLFVGTDSGVHGIFPGASLHREIRLLVALGMSPTEVLRAATSEPGRFLEPDGLVGRLVPRAPADLLVVRGNPLEDIVALAEIEAVYIGGVRLDRHPVSTAAGPQP